MNYTNALRAVACTAALVGLTGCYVVPIGTPPPQQQGGYAPPAPAAPSQMSLNARLYPSNEAASRNGMVVAYIVNQLDGRGTFNVNIAGEQFTGEATRTGNSSRGTASAAGNRGTFIECQYTMNNATQGTGACKLSTGATYNMHFGV